MPEVQRMGQGTRTKACPKCDHQFWANKKKVAPVAEAAQPEKTAKAGAMVTLEHVKAVALTIKALGGSGHVNELIGLIKDVGGVKKFKDLVEAISGTETDAIPF